MHSQKTLTKIVILAGQLILHHTQLAPSYTPSKTNLLIFTEPVGRWSILRYAWFFPWNNKPECRSRNIHLNCLCICTTCDYCNQDKPSPFTFSSNRYWELINACKPSDYSGEWFHPLSHTLSEFSSPSLVFPPCKFQIEILFGITVWDIRGKHIRYGLQQALANL